MILHLGNHLQACLPEIFLVFGILSLLVYGLTKSIEEITWLSIYTLGVTFLLVIYQKLPDLLLFNGLMINDTQGDYVKLLLLIGGISCLIMSTTYYQKEGLHSFEYSLLISISILALFILVNSNDLLVFYLAIELQSLSFYILAAYKRNSEFSTEAGLKYFVLGAFTSGLLLFGMSLIYGLTGMTNFQDLLYFFYHPFYGDWLVIGGVYAGMLFVGSALLFKVAAAPFHMWAPDVYQGSPTVVTAFFAIVPKIVIFTLFLRIYLGAFYQIPSWKTLLFISSILSMVVGALGGLFQTDIKRLLAYSTIGHTGYLLIGLVVATPEGIQALFLYLSIYIITSIPLFAIILMVYVKKYEWLTGVKSITQLSGLASKNPMLALSLALLLLSLAGIPPLAGFYGKLTIFLGGIQESMYFLAILGIFASVVAAVYYIRIVKIMYIDQPTVELQFEASTEHAALIGFSTLVVVLFTVHPTMLYNLAYQVAYSAF